jgi:hypothetical protein
MMGVPILPILPPRDGCPDSAFPILSYHPTALSEINPALFLIGPNLFNSRGPLEVTNLGGLQCLP